ncbi:hypothetical protein [Paracoccus haeundaensis]|uniref:Uncharacterized protein n=1 Tax=Paracoccus haeundaensis TaxID=225362 RepID=A0A5C4R223_9RHOB|nr:hypothetical protein [Paracoccus haeundaensis]TNH37851.1 hypothetical protein FHD67_18040 [Paracoccus haeundaensis]
MMKSIVLAAIAVAATAATAHADKVTEDQERKFLRFDTQSAGNPEISERGCSIPPRPVLPNPRNAPVNANPDQANSVLLSVYRRQNAERIVSEQACSCDMYFSDWDSALDEMMAIFEGLHFDEWASVRLENSRATNALSSEVRTICKESGVL